MSEELNRKSRNNFQPSTVPYGETCVMDLGHIALNRFYQNDNNNKDSYHYSYSTTKARGYAYAKIEYVSVRTYLSKNRIRV